MAGAIIASIGSASASVGGVDPACISVHVSVHIYDVSVESGATNASASWYESEAGLPTLFDWGISTSYGLPAISVNSTETFSNGSGEYMIPLINYLDPASEYFFDIVVSLPPSDCGSGPWQHAGSWSTSADDAEYLEGVVKTSAGAVAPTGESVSYKCFTSTGTYIAHAGTETGETAGRSSGYYSLSLQIGTCLELSATEYVITYLNSAGTWAGHWNATLVVYGPGWYNMYAALNYKTYVPSSVEFVHTKYADISDYSTEVDTTTTNTWNYGGTGGSTSASAAYRWGTNSVPAGDSLLTEIEWETTGTAVLNATDGRTVGLLGLDFFGQTGVKILENGWADWQDSAPGSGFCESFDTPTATWELNLSGSVTASSGYDIDVGASVGVSIYGVDFSGDVSVPLQNTLSSTTGHATTVTFTLTNPDPGSLVYFLINTQGGQSQASQLAVVAHVWLVSSC